MKKSRLRNGLKTPPQEEKRTTGLEDEKKPCNKTYIPNYQQFKLLTIMKKFIFLLMMLGCMNAAWAGKSDLDISKFNPWDPTTLSGSTIYFTSQWNGGSWWIGSGDYSSYSRIVFKFSALSQPVTFTVEYDYSYEENEVSKFRKTEVTAAAEAKSVTITLDRSYVDKVRQISITNAYNGENSITLSEVYWESLEFPTRNSNLTTGGEKNDFTLSSSELSSFPSQATVSIVGTVDSSEKYGYGMGKIRDTSYGELKSLGSWASAETTTFTITVEELISYAQDGTIYIQIWDGKMSSVSVSYDEISITIGSAGYATMMLPFAAEIPSGMTVYTAAVNGAKDAVVLTETGTIAANTPYIVGGTAGTYTFKGKASATDFSYTDGTLTGTYETSLNITADDYILYEGTDGIGFYPAGSGVTIDQCHAYMPASAVSGSGSAKALKIKLPDEVTVISEVPEAEKTAGDDCYNLAGQRVTADYKGVVIRNGKKYLNK